MTVHGTVIAAAYLDDVWLTDDASFSFNVVALRRVRLVLGCVTVGKTVSVNNQPPESTQPGHPSVSKRTEYERKLELILGFTVTAEITRVSVWLGKDFTD